jgi:hypothetical protein
MPNTPAELDTTRLKAIVEHWEGSFVTSIAVTDLLGRSPVAHKWKAPYRSLVIREALLRRMVDLGKQIALLSDHNGILGARIMLRCAIETTGMLVYLNQRTAAVVETEMSWPDFDGLTMQLLMGSRNGGTAFDAVNVLTMVDKANRDYGALKSMHERLSESVHPNYDGVTYGYTRGKQSDFETEFGNHWAANFGAEQGPATAYVFEVFGDAYNKQWISTMERLEAWLEANTARLETELSMS